MLWSSHGIIGIELPASLKFHMNRTDTKLFIHFYKILADSLLSGLTIFLRIIKTISISDNVGYSYITNPWLAFPFEALEVFTYQLKKVAASR